MTWQLEQCPFNTLKSLPTVLKALEAKSVISPNLSCSVTYYHSCSELLIDKLSVIEWPPLSSLPLLFHLHHINFYPWPQQIKLITRLTAAVSRQQRRASIVTCWSLSLFCSWTVSMSQSAGSPAHSGVKWDRSSNSINLLTEAPRCWQQDADKKKKEKRKSVFGCFAITCWLLNISLLKIKKRKLQGCRCFSVRYRHVSELMKYLITCSNG